MSSLTLEKVREILEFNPYHFWQLTNGDTPVTSACNTLVHEYAWQSADGAGRVDFRRAIEEAERKFKRYAGYYPGGRYFQETIDVGCFQHFTGWYNPYNINSFVGYGCSGNLLKLSSGQIQNVQTEAWASLGASGAISYTDSDGDGIKDSFSAAFTDSVTDPANIKILFLATDSKRGASTDDRTVDSFSVVRTNPTTLTATGPLWVMVKPLSYQSLKAMDGLDPNNAGVLASTVEFWGRAVTLPNAAQLVYKAADNTFQSFNLTAQICDSDTGLVSLSGADCLDPVLPCGCSGKRQQILLNYRAGADIADFDTVITYLALAELRRKICACQEANHEVYSWQLDLALPVGAGHARIQIDKEELANPIGTRAGHVNAWRVIQALRMVRGIFA